MCRTSRDLSLRHSTLEQALAECPEAWGHLDLLCAGWPCQGNSIAGSRQGMQDDRSGLWREVRRLLGLFRPRWFVGENVPGLFSVNGGRDFWAVVSDLDAFGYCVAWDVLDSQNFGLAQRRKRVFLVASFGNIGASQVLFEPESDSGDHKTDRKMEPVGICLSTRDGWREDPSGENLVASVVKASDSNPIGQFGNESNLVTQALTHYEADRMPPSEGATRNLVATVDPDRKGAVARLPKGLDAFRGYVIGNAVSVPVAQWISERILKFDGMSEPSGL